MNDLFKFISKSLQPFGYHVRPRTGLNFLRVPNLESDEGIAAARKAAGRLSPAPADANLDKFVIYLRTCMRENRNVDTRPRVTGVPMTEHSLRCILSLIRSANFAAKEIPGVSFELRVLDDHSDPSAIKSLQALLGEARIPASFMTTAQTGQGASLHEQFSRARADNAIVYFVEDDFLHEEDGIAAMTKFYRSMAAKTGSLPVLYPQEHHTLYSNLYPSYIVAGEDRHWRSVRHATHTFITHGKVVDQYWDYFENTKFVGNRKKRRLGSEDRTTNNLFKHVPGFSPLRPCAVHLQFEEILPPFYDWRPLWECNKLEIEESAPAARAKSG